MRLDAFFSDLQAYALWAHTGDPSADAAAGYESVRAVRVKVDDWFNRCRIAEFDPRLVAHEAEPPAELQMLPLARVEPGRALPLLDRVNPAWADALAGVQKAADQGRLTRSSSRSARPGERKSTRLNSSHGHNSDSRFRLKKK